MVSFSLVQHMILLHTDTVYKYCHLVAPLIVESTAGGSIFRHF